MDALVAANPGYTWQWKDGIVNLAPQGGSSLLRTKITKFQRDATDLETEAVLNDVLRLPEVRTREASLGLKQVMSGGGLAAGKDHPVPRQPVPIHIDIRNLSLQNAFNEIVKAVPKGTWLYLEKDCI